MDKVEDGPFSFSWIDARPDLVVDLLERLIEWLEIVIFPDHLTSILHIEESKLLEESEGNGWSNAGIGGIVVDDQEHD